MSSTIPPLVCNTPPPIDSDHDDDDVCSEGIDSNFSPSEDGKLNRFYYHSYSIFRCIHFVFPFCFSSIYISDVSLPATPKHSKVNKKQAKHVADRESSSSAADHGPHDTIASQHSTVPTDVIVKNACLVETSIDIITDQETTINETDNTSSPHANSDGLESAKDVERSEAEDEIQIDSNAIQVVIESPPLDDNYERNESPPSLELATGKYSDNECDINEVNDESDDFQRNSNELSVDTTSLPSLNFDSMRNSPDFRSDEIDEKKSEPEEGKEETMQPIVPDERDTTSSSDSFDGEPPPPLDATPEPECSASFDAIEIPDVNPIADDSMTKAHIASDDLPNESFAFDADFSQFATFDSENETPHEPKTSNESTEQQLYVETKPDGDDFDEDFGDFEEAPTESNPIKMGNTRSDAANNFDDDDFGDFNDFQQDATAVPVHTPLANIPKPTSFDLKSISERFKSILDTAFPTNGDDDEETSNTPSIDINSTNEIDNLVNGTTMHLKNFENAKALQHQWANSTGKSVLIKALGINAKNIVRAHTIVSAEYQ